MQKIGGWGFLQRPSGEFETAAEYRTYLVKALHAESDPGVCRRIQRLIDEVDQGVGVGVLFKARKVDRERLAYIKAFADRHPDPRMRSRAEAVLREERV